MYTITFNIVRSSVDFGKIIVEDTTAAPVGGEVSSISVVTPSGATIEMPNIDLDTSEFSKYAIPTTNGGLFLGGVYKFTITRESTDGSSGVYEYDAEFCSIYQGASVGLDVDCIRATANVVDNTVYPDGASITREMKVVFPPIAGEAAVAPFITTDTQATFAVTWANVSYLVSLAVSVSWETSVGSNVFVVEEFSVNNTVDVACPSSICSIASCVNKEIDRIYSRASKTQGFRRLPSEEFDRIMAMIGYLSQYTAFVECGNYALANKVFKSMGDLIQCDCGCDGDADGPVRIANTGGTVPVITINGTTPYINVVEVAGVYTVSLDPDFLARLLALRNSVVVSTDDSIVVSGAYNAGTNTYTYDLSITDDGAFTGIVTAGMVAPFGCWSSNQLKYRVAPYGGVTLSFIGRADTALVSGTEYIINEAGSELAVGARPVTYSTAPYTVWGKSGSVVEPLQVAGYAYVSTDGYVRFVANAAAAAMTMAEIRIYMRYSVDEETPSTTDGGGTLC